jgi:predicted HTH transcriptional regulator
MNAEGGTLFIGVDDQGNVLGLENDYKTLKIEHQNSDGLELRQSVEKYTKNKIANEFFQVKFYTLGGKEICEVIVSPTPKPVFIYDEAGKQQECYIRIGNSSKPYNLDEFEYSKRHFK